MGLEGALSLSTSAGRPEVATGRPDHICIWTPEGVRRLLGKNRVRMSRGWKVRDMVRAVRCESCSPEQGDDEPISVLRPDQCTTTSFLSNSLTRGVNGISRTAANAPVQEDRENGPGAALSTDILRYRSVRSGASIALRALDVYLLLASSICDEVDNAFRTPCSRKPLRLSTTSWELLEVSERASEWRAG